MNGRMNLPKRRWLAYLLALGGSGGWAPLVHADIVVTRWTLHCVVVPQNSAETRLVLFNQVISPFVNSHTLSWRGATNMAAYDITFDSQQLEFRADVSVTAPGITGGGSFGSACVGNLQFSTTAELLFSLDSRMEYSLPAGDRTALFTVGLGAHGGPGYLEDGYYSAPVFGDPPSGEYNVNVENMQLPGGWTYSIGYEYTLRSYSGSPSLLSTIGGHVDFSLRPVPEPATVALVLSGLAFQACRRRRHSA